MKQEIEKTYHLNGILKSEVHYLNGQTHGLCCTYFNNNHLCSICYIKYGMWHGLFQRWNKNSTRDIINQDKDRLEHGLKVEFKY